MVANVNDTLLAAGEPQEGTYYYRSLWGSYKGHVLGMFRGLVIGSIMGAAVGAVAVLAAPATLALGVTVAAFSGMGALFAGSILGNMGYSAGAAAATHAEEELRLRYPGSAEGVSPDSIDSPTPGYGHHYEVPADRDKGRWFHWKIGIPCLVAGAAIGCLVGFGVPGLVGLLFHGAGTAAAGAFTGLLAGNAGLVAGGLLGGAFGGSYGVDRAKFKSLFNYTDEWLNGKITGPGKKAEAKENAILNMSEQEAECQPCTPTITTMQRQEEYTRLYYDYFNKSFWSGLGGNAKGLAGGATVGGLIGLAAGALAVAGLGLVFGAAAVAGFAPALIGSIAAFGIHEGIKIFADAGSHAGAQSAAKEMLDVKKQRIAQGINPEAHVPETPEEKKWFSPKVMIIGAIVGAVIGGPLAAPILGAVGIHAVTAGFGAAICAAIGGMFGFTPRVFKGMSTVADKIYSGEWLDKSLAHGHERDLSIPYMAPDSPLQDHVKKPDLSKLPDVNTPSPGMQERLKTIIGSKQQSHSDSQNLAQAAAQQAQLNDRSPDSFKSAVERLTDNREKTPSHSPSIS